MLQLSVLVRHGAGPGQSGPDLDHPYALTPGFAKVIKALLFDGIAGLSMQNGLPWIS
jgi:hypothetical protein